MHAALGLDGESVWRAVLISLLGELGDKTFYLVLALSAWCPWQGLRSGGHAAAERCLVFAGASAALNVRAVLIATADSVRWGCWPDALACVALGVLATKAALELRRSRDGELDPFLVCRDPAAEAPTVGFRGETSWNKSAFSMLPRPPQPSSSSSAAAAAGAAEQKNPFPAESPQGASVGEAKWNCSAFRLPCASQEAEAETLPAGYGAAPHPSVGTADGRTVSTADGRMASLLLAFPVAFAMAFIMESDDKSEAALTGANFGGADVAVGAILGFLPPVLLATLVGHVLERQLDRQPALLLVTFLLSSLSLVSLSQALLHLGVLHLPPAGAGSRGVRGSRA